MKNDKQLIKDLFSQLNKEEELLNKHKQHICEMRIKLLRVFEEANSVFLRSDQASDEVAREIFKDLRYLIHVKL